MIKNDHSLSLLKEVKFTIYNLTDLFPAGTDKTINSLLWSLVSKVQQIQSTLEETDGK